MVVESRASKSSNDQILFPGLQCFNVVQEKEKAMAIQLCSLEKEMTIHSSVLAWEIPWTEEPGGLQSTGLQSGM